jgi:uncharacterized membrane protein
MSRIAAVKPSVSTLMGRWCLCQYGFVHLLRRNGRPGAPLPPGRLQALRSGCRKDISANYMKHGLTIGRVDPFSQARYRAHTDGSTLQPPCRTANARSRSRLHALRAARRTSPSPRAARGRRLRAVNKLGQHDVDAQGLACCLGRAGAPETKPRGRVNLSGDGSFSFTPLCRRVFLSRP